MVATWAALVKVLLTCKSLPASPVEPPFPPARTSLTPPDLGRAEVPPHHGDAVQHNFLLNHTIVFKFSGCDFLKVCHVNDHVEFRFSTAVDLSASGRNQKKNKKNPKDWLNSIKIQKSKISLTDLNKIFTYPFSNFCCWKWPHDYACHFAPKISCFPWENQKLRWF